MKLRVAGARNKRREEQWRGEWVAKQLKDGLRLMYNILHTKHGYYRLHKIAMVRADILFLFFLFLLVQYMKSSSKALQNVIFCSFSCSAYQI